MEEDKQMDKYVEWSKRGKSPAPFNIKPSLSATKKMAVELTKFINDNKLSANIAGKQFVMVDGWQFAASQLGLTAIVHDVRDISQSTPTEIRYSAQANVIHVPTDTLVSTGFAMCSNKEAKKKSFDEYAIASMAQTRAIGKAYRNNLSWLMKLAGFESTPLEEIDTDVLTEDLNTTKAKVFVRFKEVGISNTEDMLKIISKATGKQSIDNADDARAVLAEIERTLS
jgi:hypothetical protein